MAACLLQLSDCVTLQGHDQSPSLAQGWESLDIRAAEEIKKLNVRAEDGSHERRSKERLAWASVGRKALLMYLRKAKPRSL